MLPLDSIPYKEGVGAIMETQYHRANINHSHNLVKAKVLTLLRYRDAWLTVYELWQGCRFESDATLRSHCGIWSHRHINKKGHSHENILVRQARGRAGTTRTKWEYHISRRGIRWLEWNVDKAGLLDIIMGELGLASKTNSTINKLIPISESNPVSNIPDDEIKRIVQEVLNKYRKQPTN